MYEKRSHPVSDCDATFEREDELCDLFDKPLHEIHVGRDRRQAIHVACDLAESVECCVMITLVRRNISDRLQEVPDFWLSHQNVHALIVAQLFSPVRGCAPCTMCSSPIHRHSISQDLTRHQRHSPASDVKSYRLYEKCQVWCVDN